MAYLVALTFEMHSSRKTSSVYYPVRNKCFYVFTPFAQELAVMSCGRAHVLIASGKN